MVRNALVAIAGVLLVALLVALILQSRAVDAEYYVTYGNRVNLLRESQTDFMSLGEALQASYREGRAVPESTARQLERLADVRARLSEELSDARDPTIRSAFEDYSTSLERMLLASEQFIDYQDKLAEAAGVVRNESPLLVRDLRGSELQELAQDVFALAVEALDFASRSGEANAESLMQRIEALEAGGDGSEPVSGKLGRLTAAARTLTEVRDSAGAALASFAGAQVAEHGRVLFAALRDLNQAVVGKAERARLMLAVLSLLLLVSIGFVGYRLHQSYLVLNKANRELETLNASLEERVRARTEQLSRAYGELKESQTQLVHAEKMSSLGELVAGISHEINTPLWYLLSNATLMKERLQDFDGFAREVDTLLQQLRSGRQDRDAFVASLRSLDRKLHQDGLREDLEESVALIQDSIEGLEQLAEMAQSLKDFSRLDRATVGEFDVNEGLDKSLLIAKNALKHKVTVRKHYGDVPAVRCSPSQINQVFLNLIKNAADAIEEAGTIDITTRAEDGQVVVSIADSGCGIPNEMIAKIRDPFFTTKEVGKGTGLGLSIVDKIIDAHAGELIVESEAGKGSVFTIRLPVEAVVAEPEVGTETDAASDLPVADDSRQAEVVEEELPRAASV